MVQPCICECIQGTGPSGGKGCGRRVRCRWLTGWSVAATPSAVNAAGASRQTGSSSDSSGCRLARNEGQITASMPSKTSSSMCSMLSSGMKRGMHGAVIGRKGVYVVRGVGTGRG